MELFKYFLKSSDQNVFISPVSISAALAVLLEGAKEHTALQLRMALEPRYSHLDKVTIASRVYGDWRLDIKPKFMQAVRDKFELVNFSHSPEKIKKDINRWVACKTNNKIINAVDYISHDTKLLIVVAIYFEVAWRNQFIADFTVDDEFWITKNVSKIVRMMTLSDDLRYVDVRNEGIKMVELPYEYGYSMLVIVPDDIEHVEKHLSLMKVITWLKMSKLRYVHLSFPKFKMETSYTLNDALMASGVTDIFTNPDFGDMTDDKDVTVSDIFHKSYIEATEYGTIAASCTYSCVTDFGGSMDSVVLKVNKPFLFIIKHDDTFSLLFVGRVTSPNY
ncbi:gp151R [Rabbit fibroma virus]|uniref:Gp151R n=1 Tax=Rabbit fibroma virus (strain Kasza) TaxID=10272 RepID=Q9Q8T3_RFVKA|nr:gp151R [Rabbit fibroma virus]AAF18028.1 gp151R [Rabbit fibroma virus]